MSLRRALACWAAAALLLAGCGGSDEPRKAPAPQPLTVATGGQGGIYAVWGAAYARAITKQLEGYRGVPTLTTGSVENLERLRDGRAQIALTLGDTALDAVEGREGFDRPVALKALAQIYPSYVQVVTRADSDIGRNPCKTSPAYKLSGHRTIRLFTLCRQDFAAAVVASPARLL